MDAVNPDFLRLAHQLADAAGAIIRTYFRQKIDILDKSDNSPVTIADRNAEAAMRTLIEKHYPDHGIFGEEYGTLRTEADYIWVLDPIDGTRAFITGMPIFGTLIGLAYQGRPILGVLDQPVLQERWIGAQGHPATYSKAGETATQVQVRETRALSQAALYMTSPDQLQTNNRRAAFHKLEESVKERRFGGDCYATGLLASGFIDLHVECSLQPYDYMALVPIIEAAGGVATTWGGDPLSLTSGDTFLGATTQDLQQAARACLAAGQ